jgi:2-iminobutanoate/2-iminopropanoate deaminase
MKHKITTDDAPKADAILSQAIVSNGLIFVAGQVHSKPDGSMVEGSIEEKLQQIFKNIEAILEAAGAELDNIVKVTIYVTDMTQMPELNKVYPTYFNEPYPAREAVCVKELPLGASIEISVIAETT